MLVDNDVLPDGGSLHHFIWCLMFLKNYRKEKTMCSLLGGIDPKTFRKWIWIFKDAICELEYDVVSVIMIISFILSYIKLLSFNIQIVWERRFERNKGNGCLIICDGTELCIAEHGRPFYNFKFKN